MFVLVELEDTLSIHPSLFSKHVEALKNEIRKKYVNKVIPDTGLCVTLYDITSIGDCYVYPGDGSSYSKVIFRMVVFRPFVGEILEGKIKNSNSEGIQLSLDFFDDVYIPSHYLQEPSVFKTEEQLWYWNYNSHQLFLDLGSKIRFRVDSVVWGQKASKKPPLANAPPSTDIEEAQPPMLLVAAINEPGLGNTLWWAQDVEEEEE